MFSDNVLYKLVFAFTFDIPVLLPCWKIIEQSYFYQCFKY